MQAAKAEIAGHLARTTEALEKKVQEANQAADEALAELDKFETRVEALEEELKTEKKDGENYRQEAEKKEAVDLQKIQGLKNASWNSNRNGISLSKPGKPPAPKPPRHRCKSSGPIGPPLWPRRR